MEVSIIRFFTRDFNGTTYYCFDFNDVTIACYETEFDLRRYSVGFFDALNATAHNYKVINEVGKFVLPVFPVDTEDYV